MTITILKSRAPPFFSTNLTFFNGKLRPKSVNLTILCKRAPSFFKTCIRHWSVRYIWSPAECSFPGGGGGGALGMVWLTGAAPLSIIWGLNLLRLFNIVSILQFTAQLHQKQGAVNPYNPVHGFLFSSLFFFFFLGGGGGQGPSAPPPLPQNPPLGHFHQVGEIGAIGRPGRSAHVSYFQRVSALMHPRALPPSPQQHLKRVYASLPAKTEPPCPGDPDTTVDRCER